MNVNGPIIIIEDDIDDIEIYNMVFVELGYTNHLEIFQRPTEALQYLKDTTLKPFLIFSDVNMPEFDGYTLKETITKDEKLLTKCIPFLYITTGATPEAVKRAYKLSVQGIFLKPTNLLGWTNMIKGIMYYWQTCLAPSHV